MGGARYTQLLAPSILALACPVQAQWTSPGLLWASQGKGRWRQAGVVYVYLAPEGGGALPESGLGAAVTIPHAVRLHACMHLGWAGHYDTLFARSFTKVTLDG